MNVSVEKTWLMDYEVLRLVNQCRRLILAEFGFKPALNNNQLREQLAHYAGKSRQRCLQESYAELRLALETLEGPDPVTPSAREEKVARMYRGQPLPEPEAGAPVEQTGTGKTIIYRGRVVRTD